MQNKMYKTVRYALIASFFTLYVGTVFPQQSDPVVMILGNDSIRLSEFKASYSKNNNLKKATEKDLREYIELFANFRLKCMEADSMKLDTLPKIKKELNGYRTQAAAPYLTEKSVNDQLVDEGIEHLKWDVRASHIMKKLPLEPTPKDTLKVYQEMIKLRESILKGNGFAQVALKESEDPSARPQYKDGKMIRSGNKGDLGYFTAFNMIYEFEKGAYGLEKGSISMPIRSPFGYHLIYLQDKQPAVSRFTACQILITYPENATAADSAAVKAKAEEAYKALQQGMSFDEAVEKYCTDEGLRSIRGIMDPFSPSRFEGDFVAPLYSLKEGEVAPAFETRYGWHIVKLITKELFVEDAYTRGNVKSKVARDNRSNLGPEALVDRLKKEYGFKEASVRKKEVSPKEEFYHIDSLSLFNGNWEKESFTSDKVMFTFADQKRSQQDFAAYIEQNQFQGMRNVSMRELVDYAYSLFVHHSIIEYEDSQLEKKYPEFKQLMKEYRDGIILYELSEQKIWLKAETDSAGLAAFYETIKDEYMYPLRANAVTYTLENAKAYNLFCKMKNKGYDLDAIDAKFAQKGWIISAREEKLAQFQNKEFDQLCPWEILKSEGSLSVSRPENFQYITIDKLYPSPKPLNEVRGLVISRYQNKLEDEWVKDLRKNHTVRIDYDSILSLIK